jgi:hypothetical protein
MKIYAGSDAFFAFHLTTVILVMVFAYIDETVSLYLSIFWILSMVAEGVLGLYQERLGILHTEDYEDYCELCGQIRKDKKTDVSQNT